MRRTRMLASGCSLIGIAALAAVLTAPTAIATSAGSAGSTVGVAKGPTGSAYALSVTTTLLDKPLVRLDPRPTASYPGVGRDSLAKVGPNVAGLVTANALTASSAIRGRTLTSAADIADVTVKDIVTARVVSADCTAGPAGLAGRSNIAELSVLGQRIDLNVVRGEFDVLGVATVRVDEQIRTGDTLTVNAVHVIVGSTGGPVGAVTSADIVLSQAKCTWVGGTTTPAPPTTTTMTTRPTTSTQHPTSSRAQPHPTTSIAGGHGIRKAAAEEELAETGATGVLPISVAGLILVAGGGWALFLARRGRTGSGS